MRDLNAPSNTSLERQSTDPQRPTKRRAAELPTTKRQIIGASTLIDEARRLKSAGIRSAEEGNLSTALHMFAQAVIKLEKADPDLVAHLDAHKGSRGNSENKQQTDQPRSPFDTGTLRAGLHDMRAQLFMSAKEDFQACREAELAVLCRPDDGTFHQTLARALLNFGEVGYAIVVHYLFGVSLVALCVNHSSGMQIVLCRHVSSIFVFVLCVKVSC